MAGSGSGFRERKREARVMVMDCGLCYMNLRERKREGHVAVGSWRFTVTLRAMCHTRHGHCRPWLMCL